MNDLFLEFLLEAEENVQALNEAVDVLIQSPGDSEAFKRVLRALHTLKGGFGVFQMTSVQNACHEIENICGKDPSVHSKEFYLWLQSQAQELESFLKTAREAGTPSDLPIHITPWTGHTESGDVGGAMSLEDEFAIAEKEAAKFFENVPRAEAESEADAEPAPEAVTAGKNAAPAAADPTPTLKVVHSEPSSGSAQSAPTIQASSSNSKSSGSAPASPAKPSTAAADSHVRVSLAKIDDVLGSIWEIFMARNQISYLIEQSRPLLQNEPALLRTWESMDSSLRRMVGELESQVMEMRMVPLSGVFQRMGRLVQQFSHTSGKEIAFRGVGETIELDKRIVDSLADPLIHLVRNAMDHGIEEPQVRRAKGKDSTGHITLKVEISGTEVILSVMDDGKGLNPEVIRKKAIANGLAHAADMSDEEVVNLIFESGFSTAEKVTDISGRGVGMDAVKSQLEALSGTIEVDSVPDKGCTFIIRIPQKVSVLNSLICSINEMDYAIPHSLIIEAFTVDQADLKQNGNEWFYTYRGEPIKVYDLTKYFPNQDDFKLKIIKRKASLLIVRDESAESKCHALLVSQICRNQELVIKPLPALCQQVPYVSGVSILADGRPIFILSTTKLVQQLTEKREKANHVAMAS